MTWVDDARALPIAFAQVREDPLVDERVLRTLGPEPHRVLMIASGGDSVAWLASRMTDGSIHVVDPNPAQIALTQLKVSLIGKPGRRLVLGHDLHFFSGPETWRRDLILEACESQRIDASKLGPMSALTAHGIDNAGRYERVFDELRRELHALGKSDALDRLRFAFEPAAQTELVAASRLAPAIALACEKAFELGALQRLFGEKATANALEPFHEHFAKRITLALERFSVWKNPWLHTLLCGGFPMEQHDHPWLGASGGEDPPALEYSGETMQSVLEWLSEGSVDFLHLSNICDWLSEVEARALFDRASRVLAPGGTLIVRQLNSMLPLRTLCDRIEWDEPLSAELTLAERAFFYRAVHVGRVRA